MKGFGPSHHFRRKLAASVLWIAAIAFAISWLGRWLPIADNINLASIYWWPILLVAVLVASWLLRDRNALWAGLALGFLALVTGLVLFRPLLHQSPPPATSTQQVSLIEFNLLKSNRQTKVDAEWLAEQDADILVLLEAMRMHKEWGAALRIKYPTIVSCSDRYPCSTVLFSKFPLIRSTPLAADGDAENRKALSALTATLDVNGTPLTIFAAHLDRPWPLGEQERWVEPMSKIARNITDPAIMTGDFNSAPWTHTMGAISDAGDFRLGSGFATSWPSWNTAPFRLPLDQLYVRGPVRTSNVQAGPRRGSDHLPLMIKLEIPAVGNAANPTVRTAQGRR